MDLVIFDLDGTLIDSREDITISVNAARNNMRLPPLPADLIASYVGNGAPVLIRRAMPPDATEEDLQQALAFFMQFYREHSLAHTKLYPGVQDALDRMLGDGVRMAVLTNKPVRISNDIVEGLGLGLHFFRIYGGNSFDQKKPHPVGIQALLKETGIAREKTAMVGDSGVDVQTARNAEVEACGVLYGFQPDSFDQFPPDLLVENMGELAEYVITRRS